MGATTYAQPVERERDVRGYTRVFSALNDAGVSYVVVGGVAVVLQGHARLTVDLDLVVDLAAEPASTAIDVLLGLGFLPRLPVDAHDFADVAVREQWVNERNLQVFSLYHPDDPLLEIDLFATHPLPLDELVAAADAVDLTGVQVPVASVAHLVALKRAAGRPRDLEDVEALLRLDPDRDS